MDRKVMRFFKIIKIISILFLLTIVGFLIFAFILPEKASVVSSYLLDNGQTITETIFICFLLFTILMVILLSQFGKNYRKKTYGI